MRNPNSFIPFSFGERMCLGYKFAQVMLPTLVSKIVYNFDLEFEDKEFMKEDTHVIASVFQNHQTPINMRVKRTPEYAAWVAIRSTELTLSNFEIQIPVLLTWNQWI